MEQLPPLGTAIADVVIPTYQIYAPLLLKRAEAIRSTHCETFSYGPHARQQLDIYTPPASATPVTGHRNSALVFLYGGGLVRGDKSNKEFLAGLVYANLGHYFSQHLGFPVAIVDYRLLSHGAQYPSGGEDVALAMRFIVDHLATREPLDLFLMGNSAGGIHSCTYLLAHDFAQQRSQILGHASALARLKGVVLLGTPYHFEEADPGRAEILQAYYGADVSENCPLGLLRKAKATGSIESLRDVNILVMTAALDPEDEVVGPGRDFIKEWKDTPSVASKMTTQAITGHNHISPVLGVGTDIPSEEVWCRDVVSFIASSV